jgi:hypothetical protein
MCARCVVTSRTLGVRIGGIGTQATWTNVMSIPNDLDTLLPRDQMAAALTEAGYPIKAATLATKATRGGGPPYQVFGRRPLYRWGDALAWAKGRLTAPRRSTSEDDVTSGHQHRFEKRVREMVDKLAADIKTSNDVAGL